MAVEKRRGCGYRKVGGMYLISDALSMPCDRMPYELTVCPCCGEGIKQSRGWTWIDPVKLFGYHKDCKDIGLCPMCTPELFFSELIQSPPKNAGLLWVGEKFYTVDEYLREAGEMGVSRRIAAIPRDFEIGKTFVFLAHAKAVTRWDTERLDEDGQVGTIVETPGIFCCFVPKRIELIVNESEYLTFYKIKNDPEVDIDSGKYSNEEWEAYGRLRSAFDRGITLVPVPDNDPDHH